MQLTLRVTLARLIIAAAILYPLMEKVVQPIDTQWKLAVGCLAAVLVATFAILIVPDSKKPADKPVDKGINTVPSSDTPTTLPFNNLNPHLSEDPDVEHCDTCLHFDPTEGISGRCQACRDLIGQPWHVNKSYTCQHYERSPTVKERAQELVRHVITQCLDLEFANAYKEAMQEAQEAVAVNRGRVDVRA